MSITTAEHEHHHPRNGIPGAFYPLVLVGEGRHAIVLGGGGVATRKVQRLLGAGVHPTVLSPELSPDLQRLAADGEIIWLRGTFPDQRPDVASFDLAIAASNDSATNAAFAEECNVAGVWVNVVDDPERSDFINPAVIHLEDQGLVVTISTFGQSPGRAKRLRERLEELLKGMDWGIGPNPD